jgi:hypothetical protein
VQRSTVFLVSASALVRMLLLNYFVVDKTGAVLRSDNFAEDKIVVLLSYIILTIGAAAGVNLQASADGRAFSATVVALRPRTCLIIDVSVSTWNLVFRHISVVYLILSSRLLVIVRA